MLSYADIYNTNDVIRYHVAFRKAIHAVLHILERFRTVAAAGVDPGEAVAHAAATTAAAAAAAAGTEAAGAAGAARAAEGARAWAL